MGRRGQKSKRSKAVAAAPDFDVGAGRGVRAARYAVDRVAQPCDDDGPQLEDRVVLAVGRERRARGRRGRRDEAGRHGREREAEGELRHALPM